MTIESASHPTDLSTWDGSAEAPFYFEVFGETSPAVDTAYAEVVPAGSEGDGSAQTTARRRSMSTGGRSATVGTIPGTAACSGA